MIAAAATSKNKSAERDNVKFKLDLATALSHLASTSYEKAAISFLKIGPPKDLGDWIGKWNAMCSRDLPTIDHQVEIFGTSIFGSYIEQEPYMPEFFLIEAYMNSNFNFLF